MRVAAQVFSGKGFDRCSGVCLLSVVCVGAMTFVELLELEELELALELEEPVVLKSLVPVWSERLDNCGVAMGLAQRAVQVGSVADMNMCILHCVDHPCAFAIAAGEH